MNGSLPVDGMWYINLYGAFLRGKPDKMPSIVAFQETKYQNSFPKARRFITGEAPA